MRQDNQNIADDYTLIEPHHKVKNNTATPRLGGGGEEKKEYHHTYLYFGDF